MNKEFLKMQKTAGLITESQYKKLVENEEAKVVAAAEKVEDNVIANPKLEQAIDKLTPEQITQLKKELASLGVTANSSVEDVADKIEPKIEEVLNEAEGDTKQKVASALSTIGGGLMKSLLIPIIPIAIGSTGIGVATGFAITALTAGALIGLAKLLGEKEGSSEFGNN
jgi:hypothetical protein